MRRLSLVIVVAATTVLVPMFAMAGNQEVADQIAQNLKHSGKLSDYRIAVKFQDGTATIKGRVASQEQMNTVLRLVFKTPGVSRVVNQMTIGESETTGAVAKNSSPHSAQRVASSYAPSPVEQVTAMEPGALPQKHLANNAPRPINSQMPIPVAMRQATPIQNGGVPGAPSPMYAGAQGGVAPVRYDRALHAELCLAKLRGLSKLRRSDLSQAVFTNCLAVHRPILPISPSSIGMAKSNFGMERWLVVPRFQG